MVEFWFRFSFSNKRFYSQVQCCYRGRTLTCMHVYVGAYMGLLKVWRVESCPENMKGWKFLSKCKDYWKPFQQHVDPGVEAKKSGLHSAVVSYLCCVFGRVTPLQDSGFPSVQWALWLEQRFFLLRFPLLLSLYSFLLLWPPVPLQASSTQLRTPSLLPLPLQSNTSCRLNFEWHHRYQITCQKR